MDCIIEFIYGYSSPLSSSSHFLMTDFEGTLPVHFTFPLMRSAGVGRIPH